MKSQETFLAADSDGVTPVSKTTESYVCMRFDSGTATSTDAAAAECTNLRDGARNNPAPVSVVALPRTATMTVIQRDLLDRTIESSSTTITQLDFSANNGQPQTVIKVVTDSGFQIRTQTTTNVYPAFLCVNIHPNST